MCYAGADRMVGSARAVPRLCELRYFFHLKNYTEEYLDETGIEARSLEQAYSQAMEAIQELREEEGGPDEWTGWRLEATDAAGTVMFCIDLAATLH